MIRMSSAFVQPIASDDVAEAMGGIIVGKPVNDIIEVAGPEKFRLDELVRKYLAAVQDEHEVITDITTLYFDAMLNEETLIPGKNARAGTVRYEEWISQPDNRRLLK